MSFLPPPYQPEGDQSTESYQGGSGPQSAVRPRRVPNVAAPQGDQVSRYYEEADESTLRSTVCMDWHVLKRMQEDLDRAERRRMNPESAMPDRGELYLMDLQQLLGAQQTQPLYAPTSCEQSSLVGTPKAMRDYSTTLPPLSTRNMARPSDRPSTTTSPFSAASRQRESSRAPSRALSRSNSHSKSRGTSADARAVRRYP